MAKVSTVSWSRFSFSFFMGALQGLMNRRKAIAAVPRRQNNKWFRVNLTPSLYRVYCLKKCCNGEVSGWSAPHSPIFYHADRMEQPRKKSIDSEFRVRGSVGCRWAY